MNATPRTVETDAPPGPSRLLLTLEEAAETLGIGRSTLYRLLASRDIRSVKIGWMRRIAVADLEAYVERLRSASRAESELNEPGGRHGA